MATKFVVDVLPETCTIVCDYCLSTALYTIARDCGDPIGQSCSKHIGTIIEHSYSKRKTKGLDQ